MEAHYATIWESVADAVPEAPALVQGVLAPHLVGVRGAGPHGWLAPSPVRGSGPARRSASSSTTRPSTSRCSSPP